MKKRIFYTSLAMGLALVSLVGCGKKKTKGDDPTNDDEDLTSPYSVNYENEYHNINFYDGGYATDDSGNLVTDDYGLYTLDGDKTTVLSVPVNVGQELTWLPTPKKDGYKFVGWYVDEGLSTPFYYTSMPQGDLVAYARWQIDADKIYVADTLDGGSPLNDGSSKKKPMTLLEASRVYKPGAEIILTEGTYSEKRTIVFGQQGDSNNITKVYSDGAVTLDFSRMAEADANVGIKITGNYHQLKSFTVKGAGDNGVLVGSSFNKVEDCVFTENHDTGLQISRYSGSTQPYIDQWPANNLILNCTSYNNSDDGGEDADGFAAKLTVGYNNVFDGCMAYWNVDDGWDLYAKQDSGRIGLVRIQNCVSFQNGHKLNSNKNDVYTGFDGDGNGFKLGGTSVPGEVIVENCVAAWNYAHGFTDNSNPGVISISNCTSINNGQYGTGSGSSANTKEYDNFNLNRSSLIQNKNYYSGLISYYSKNSKNKNTTYSSDEFNGSINDSIFIQDGTSYVAEGPVSVQSDTKYGNGFTTSKNVSEWTDPTGTSKNAVNDTYPITLISTYGTANFHSALRNDDGSINLHGLWGVSSSVTNSIQVGANLNSTTDTYAHFKFTEPSLNETTDEATAREIIDSIDLSINKDYIYNDIYLPSKLRGVTISWSSSNTNAITIGNETTVENGLSYRYGVIAARLDQDTKVTLTASITVGGKTYTKSFEVTCQALDPRIGTISGIDNVTALKSEASSIVIDSYVVKDYTSTSLTLDAGTDYTVSKTIEYVDDYMSETEALSATGYTTVSSITNAGTYRIKYTFSINGYPDTVVYRIVTIVEDTDTLEVTTASVYLNSYIDNEATISGDVNYTSGDVYAVAVAQGATAPTAAEIKAGTSTNTTIISNGIAKQTLTSRSINLKVSVPNYEGAIDIYLVVENANGLGAVKKIADVQAPTKVSTYEDLMNALNDGTKAYVLTADIDCGNETVAQSKSASKTFTGYFDGKYHTISNLNIDVTGEGGGLFYKTSGGAVIKNLELVEIHVNQTDITSTSGGKTGILIGAIEEGDTTVSNIHIHNSSVNAYQRVGGIVGEIKGLQNVTTYPTVRISNCSITCDYANDLEHYSIRSGYETTNAAGTKVYTGGKYVGGICAHLQYGANVYIDSCFVKQEMAVYNQYAGGILGRIDPQTELCEVVVSNCVFAGVLNGLGDSASYCAGIVGGRSSGLITITNNTCIGTCTSKNSGTIVSTNLTTKSAIGTISVYKINEYTTFENNYYLLSAYDSETSNYGSEEEYYAAETLNKEWMGTAVLSDKMTETWWNTNMAKFMESFEYGTNNLGAVVFTLKVFNMN